MMLHLTYTKLRQRASARRMSVTRIDCEIRVAYGVSREPDAERREAAAYYTDDIDDAYHTMIAMATAHDARPFGHDND